LSVGIVIVTHGQTGQSLVNDAEFILGQSLRSIRCIAFNQPRGQSIGDDELKQFIAQSDHGEGVLYRDTPLESLTHKAMQGGKRGVEAFHPLMDKKP